MPHHHNFKILPMALAVSESVKRILLKITEPSSEEKYFMYNVGTYIDIGSKKLKQKGRLKSEKNFNLKKPDCLPQRLKSRFLNFSN